MEASLLLGEKVLIGEGAYGRVYKVADKQGRLYAAKHIRLDQSDEGIPYCALREIALLKSLKDHPNIVPLHDVVYRPEEKEVRIYFEFCDGDLKKFLTKTPSPLPMATVQSFLRQILEGLRFCHAKKVLHRDLKPLNILVNSDGTVKLADFGLARLFLSPDLSMTHEVETLHYRAPEILLGQKSYTYSMDLWAVGCIFAELLTKRPFFIGRLNELDQLFSVLQVRGTPTLNEWPSAKDLPDFKATFPKWHPQPLNQLLPTMSPSGLDLLDKLLQLNPDLRISADDALKHHFFKEHFQ